MNYFYGPVLSRRLGFSLGVNLLPRKVCPFDCIYCQLGPTGKKSIRRCSWVNLLKFKKELAEIIKKHPKIDYITISGCGEPTLHKNLGRIISCIKEVTRNKYPVCVITNSSLLDKKELRKELSRVDLIIPSLDAVSPHLFDKIDRPHKAIKLNKIISGLIKLRKEFKGKIWLEIMLIGNLNDTSAEARKLKKVIAKINPDKVQLNLPVRPSGSRISFPQYQKIKAIKKIIGPKAEIISSFYKETQKNFSDSLKKDIVNFLKIRPADLKDLTKSLGVAARDVNKYLKELLHKKIIRKDIHCGKIYFRITTKSV
jgi:wyosine [tRNA(Phe)-imidazoG37] synthetase (radical SAM superfamily)